MRVEPSSPRAAVAATTAGARWLAVLGALALALGAAATFYPRLFPNGLRAAAHEAAVARGYGAHGIQPGRSLALRNAARRVADNLLHPVELPTLVIDIKFRHLQTLYARREQALQVGFLIQEEGDMVPASIRIGERTVPVRLRLKGDMLDHLRTDKWSFRVHTRDGQEILGLRRFSLQSPDTRGFQAELLFLETLRRFGVLAPSYRFVKVVVDGNDVGVMAMEEHFAKELLEREGRKDGVILKFDESLLWESRRLKGERNQRLGGPFESHVTAPIDAFQMARILESEPLNRQFEVGAGLLRAFVDGQLPASAVFDVELLGSFLAVAEAWDAWHAAVWPNLRFYLNPLTLRLEPIGFDADIREALGVGTTIFAEGILAEQMLHDPAVRAAFDRTLREIRTGVDSGELLDELRRVEEPALRALRTEYVFLEPVDLDRFAQRVRALPVAPSAASAPPPYPVHVLAELVHDGERHYLEVANPLPEPVTIRTIEWIDAAGTATPFASSTLNLPRVLPPTPINTRPATFQLDYVPDADSPQGRLRLTTTVAGNSAVKVGFARRGVPALHANPLPGSSVDEARQRHSFLTFDEHARVATVRKGSWTVDGSLVVPKGYTLHVEAGTTLRFPSDGALLAYGATVLRGTAQDPVVLEPVSEARGWQGVVVHRAPERSSWSYVTVRGTTGVAQGAWSFTGATTFYRSDVTMAHCTLAANRAEDALNIVHSDFVLEDLLVSDTTSDGFDSDFSTGRILRGEFRRIGSGTGADAVDVSGSTVAIEGTRFSAITDKAISVGEGSTLQATDVRVDRVGAGAVSKDGSTLRLQDAEIHAARVAGLMTYVKKPEYGAARLTASNVRITDTERPALAQSGSRMEIDGEPAKARDLDVDQLYDTVMRPSLRR